MTAGNGSGPVSVTVVPKPWGHETIWAHTDRYVGKVLHIKAGHELSVQYHDRKDETIHLLSGEMIYRVSPRAGEPLHDIRLHAGDTLLLQVGPYFSRAFRNNPDFYLISDVEDSRPVRYDRAGFAAIIFLAMIAAFVSGKVDIMLAGFLAAGAMVAARCISPIDARKSVDLPVLIAIASSFGVGKALEQSGVAKLFAGVLVEATRS